MVCKQKCHSVGLDISMSKSSSKTLYNYTQTSYLLYTFYSHSVRRRVTPRSISIELQCVLLLWSDPLRIPLLNLWFYITPTHVHMLTPIYAYSTLSSGVSRGVSGCPEPPPPVHDFFYQVVTPLLTPILISHLHLRRSETTLRATLDTPLLSLIHVRDSLWYSCVRLFLEE